MCGAHVPHNHTCHVEGTVHVTVTPGECISKFFLLYFLLFFVFKIVFVIFVKINPVI
jgi:hypothetical protein